MLGIMFLPIGRRKHVSAIGADGVAGGDHGMAVGAFLGRRLAVAIRNVIPNANLVDGTMPKHISAEIKDEAILLARM